MGTAWFVDGAYLFKVSQGIGTSQIDYVKLRQRIEVPAGEIVEEAYYFNCDPDPPSAARSSFNRSLAVLPPDGPGLRVKLYWLSRKRLSWPQSMGGQAVIHPETHGPYEMTQQKGVDVGLAFHLVQSFAKRGWRKLFLAAGDGDFAEVVQYLVETENVDVTLIGTPRTISSELAPYSRKMLDLTKEIESLATSRVPAPGRSASSSAR